MKSASSLVVNGSGAIVYNFKNCPNLMFGPCVEKEIFNVNNFRMNRDQIFNNRQSPGDGTPYKDKKYQVKGGILLIINQIDFYIFDEQKMLKQPNPKLEKRVGTNEDSRKLKQVFAARGYKIEEERNLTGTEILVAIKNVTHKCISYDSLIVCILSHGKEGAIYGSDSKLVSLTGVQDLIAASEYLCKKPKILIVQACQGGAILPIKIRSGGSHLLKSDGHPHRTIRRLPTTVSGYRDFCVAQATIPRFAAIRDMRDGSWFIQTLCNVIELEGHRKDFLEILTQVNDEVTKRLVKRTGCMVPWQANTFSRKLFLPSKK